MVEQQEFYKAPVVSMLQGRLGNCMWEIAAGKSYAERCGREYYIFFNDAQGDIDEFKPIISRFERVDFMATPRIEWYERQTFQFNPIGEFEDFVPVYLFGYYGNERYYDKEKVKEWFKAPDDVLEKINQKYGDLSNCVHISVRRGDYVNLGHALNPSWYEFAYHEHFEGKRVFITSDDIGWCKNNLWFPDAIYSEDSNAIEDLYAGVQCKDHIAYNGSFGWWCAWLGEKPDSKTVIPSNWFVDPPKNWIEKDMF